MDNTSTDGNCGSNSETNATCLGSTFGDCCSSKGYCGHTSAYCAEGCQLGFGDCNDASVQTVSTTGSCGSTLTSNVTCVGSTYGDCCSSKGFCGGDSNYCGAGCQDGFGSCDVALTSSANTTSSATSSTTSGTTSSTTSETSDGGLSKGAIAGISVGAAVGGLALLAFLVWFAFLRRKRRSTGPEDTKQDPAKVVVPVVHEVGGRQMHEMDTERLVRPPVELPGTG
ncbi:hypothetical protein BJX76DRAFT_350402 [Aspergillus varians]